MKPEPTASQSRHQRSSVVALPILVDTCMTGCSAMRSMAHFVLTSLVRPVTANLTLRGSDSSHCCPVWITCSCLAPGLAAEVESDLLARQQAVVSLTSVARPAHADISCRSESSN